MKKLISLFAFLFCFSFLSLNAAAQNVNVNPNPASYPTLKDAFDAINAGTHTGAITVDIINNTTEGATAVLNASGGSSSYTSIVISPSGGTWTVSGTIAGPLVNLNGAKNVTIDGLNNGNSLTISNLSTSSVAGTSTIRFINDASNNIVKNCTILGSSSGTAAQNGTASSPAAATILFGGSTGSTGNDNNTISNNDIGQAGVNLPVIAISSAGQSLAIANDNNSITGNNIFNFYGTSGANGIAVGSNSSAFTISSNKFYQTASRSGLATAIYWEAIFISTASGGGYTVSNNIIGYANNSGTGMLTNSGGRFAGIDLTAVAASPVSNIQGNTINGINWTTASGASTAGAGVINGIIVKAGGVNIGTTTLNTIGSNSGTGSSTTNIFITSTTSGTGIYGIYVSSSTGATVSNNIIGAIATSGTSAIGFTFNGIVVAGTGSHTVTNNTVGNSTANNISAGVIGTTNAATFVTGIVSSSTGTAVSIGNSVGTGNTIQNLRSSGSRTSSSLYGIQNTGAAGTMNINYNSFTSNKLDGGGFDANTIYYAAIINSGAVTTALNINNNTVNSATITISAFSGTSSFIICIGSGVASAVSIQNNILTGFTFTGATSSTGTFYGIYHVTASGVASKNVSNNEFNDLTLKTSGSVLLINLSDPTPNVTVTGNSIGTQFTRSVSSTANLIGIYSIGGTAGVASGTQTISNNNFSNVTSNTNAAAAVWGILWQPGVSAGANSPVVNISGNTVSNYSNSNNSQIIGIYGDWSKDLNISGNTVSGFTSFGPVTGIQSGVLGASGNVFNNKIHSLNTNGISGTAAVATGINVLSSVSTDVTSVYNIYNNTIGNLSAPSASGVNQIIGISIAGPAATNYHNLYYNTISLNASSTGAEFGTSAVSVSTTPTVTMINNALVNTSTPNSTGLTVAYRRSTTTLGTYGDSSNYNLYYAGTPGTNNLIFYDGTNSDQTLPDFKARVTTRDNYSYSGNPIFTSATDLSPVVSDPSCWLLNGNGIAIGSIGSDIAGNPRSTTIAGGGTDIGAYEFTPSVAPTVVSSGPLLSPLAASTFEVGTATVASINVTGGSVSNVDFQYYSGTVPPGLPGSPPVTDGYGNVYWNFVPSGTGFTYDLVIHYSPALLGTTIESAIKVAIEDPLNNDQGFYTPYPQGTGVGESDVDFINHNITVRGLTDMGKFIITDATSALPVELASFVSSVNGRNVDLNWATTNESNNSGFDIERSVVNGSWSKIGNVAGNGTTTTGHSYSFTDRNIASGNYNYRLKQIDFNGNFAYHNLNSEVNVGIPTKYDLSQNYPNPFNPSTKISYDIPFDGKVSLTIFDMSGKEIASLVNEVKTAGYYSVNFNASSLSSGTYFYRINAEGNGKSFVSTKKMMLVK